MNKVYLIILSMTAILGIGGYGMYASFEYSNQPTQNPQAIDMMPSQETEIILSTTQYFL